MVTLFLSAVSNYVYHELSNGNQSLIPDSPPPPLPPPRNPVKVAKNSKDLMDGTTLLSSGSCPRKFLLIAGLPPTASLAEVETFVQGLQGSSVKAKVVEYDDWTGEAVFEAGSPDGKLYGN